MQKYKRLTILMLISMALIVLSAGIFTSKASAAKLADANGHWAEQAITEMNAYDIISGYPDGTFKPNQSVTKLEAVALLIRVLGLETKAKEQDNATIDYKMPPNLLWGRGYLIIGVQEGMLDKNYLDQLQPGAPATRAEVAVLVYHALDLSPGSGELTFVDAGQIPQAYKSCISAVVDKNIMQGLPGNYFAPGDNINRGQMAVLLARLIDKKFADPYPSRRYSGTLTSIDSANQLLVMQADNYSSLQKKISPDCKTFLDEKKVALSLLEQGDTVKVVLNKNDQISYIQALRHNVAESYQGKVNSVYFQNNDRYLSLVGFDGGSKSYPVSEGASGISHLSEGAFVSIEVSGGKITEINPLDTTKVKGTVTNKSSSALTVRRSNGTKTSYNLASNVLVLQDGSVKTYSQVKLNKQVEITIFNNKVLEIDLLGAGDAEGKIKSLDTTGTMHITIRDDDGDEEEYKVDDKVKVYDEDGDRIDFDELKKGEWVVLELDDDDCVTRIEVDDEDDDDEDEAEGKIRSLDTTGTMHITIRDDDGDEEEYEVADNVKVYDEDNDRIDFDELKKGDWVRLEFNSDDCVIRIYIDEEDDDDEDEVEGKIRSLDTTGTMHITIRDDDGDEEEYEVADNVKVYDEDGDRIDFDELDKGDWVTLELDSDDCVTRIYVDDDDEDEDEDEVEGEVRKLDTSGTMHITIRNDDGDEEEYEVADNVKVYDEDNDRIDFDELDKGDWVTLRLDDNERVTRIDVDEEEDDDDNVYVEGRIKSLDKSGTMHITIRDDDGEEEEYEVDDDVEVYDENGNEIDFDELIKGHYVTLEINDDDIVVWIHIVD